LTLKGDLVGAVGDSDHAVALSPNDATILNNACWARALANRDLAAALDLCGKSLHIQPKSAPTLDSRGFVQFRLGKLNDALSDYDAALAITPKQPSSLFMRGVVKDRLGQDGSSDIAAALALSPGVAQVYKSYGVTP
jgi:tetratricopeptide (TPR) repeat protein